MHADLYKLTSAKVVTLHTILLCVGGTCYFQHTLHQFKHLGLDYQSVIQLARQLHAHSVMYFKKLVTAKCAIANNNTSHSQVGLEWAADYAPQRALLATTVKPAVHSWHSTAMLMLTELHSASKEQHFPIPQRTSKAATARGILSQILPTFAGYLQTMSCDVTGSLSAYFAQGDLYCSATGEAPLIQFYKDISKAIDDGYAPEPQKVWQKVKCTPADRPRALREGP
eukprot:1147439-Pelagomonas_calceolata.AAC.7